MGDDDAGVAVAAFAGFAAALVMNGVPSVNKKTSVLQIDFKIES